MVTAVLREAGIFNLLLQKKITRMPILPAANYDDHPEMVEVSSSDEEMDEVDEPEEETTSPTARGPRAEQTSGETDAGGDDIEVEEDEEDVGGQPSEAKKRRTEVRNIRNQFEKLIADASNVQYCFICGGMHDIDECPTPDDENMRDTSQSTPYWKDSIKLLIFGSTIEIHFLLKYFNNLIEMHFNNIIGLFQ